MLLIDEIEEEKRERPEGLVEETGACMFCGQIRKLQTLFGWPEDKVNEAVTEMCNCDQAIQYTAKKQQKGKAKERITELFGEESEKPTFEEDVEIMNIAVDTILDRKLNSITMEIGKGLKAKISKTAKGYVKVERIETSKRTFEE